MRIVITGSTGQLGSDLCLMLAKETVIPMDLPDFDLTRQEIEAQIQDAKPDVIIHAGAYTDVDGSEHNPDIAMAVNRDGTTRVARAAARAGARLIYVSTDYVMVAPPQFPTLSRMPHIQSTPTACRNGRANRLSLHRAPMRSSSGPPGSMDITVKIL